MHHMQGQPVDGEPINNIGRLGKSSRILCLAPDLNTLESTGFDERFSGLTLWQDNNIADIFMDQPTRLSSGESENQHFILETNQFVSNAEIQTHNNGNNDSIFAMPSLFRTSGTQTQSQNGIVQRLLTIQGRLISETSSLVRADFEHAKVETFHRLAEELIDILERYCDSRSDEGEGQSALLNWNTALITMSCFSSLTCVFTTLLDSFDHGLEEYENSGKSSLLRAGGGSLLPHVSVGGVVLDIPRDLAAKLRSRAILQLMTRLGSLLGSTSSKLSNVTAEGADNQDGGIPYMGDDGENMTSPSVEPRWFGADGAWI